jgi:hypothetical protein
VQIGLDRFFLDLNCPDHSLNALKFIRLVNLCVSKKLGPGTIGSVRKVVDRSFSVSMPTRGRLFISLPDEWTILWRMSIDDHVATE